MQRAPAAPELEDLVLPRFTVSQRLEHFTIMISFTALVVTGLAQRFYTATWSRWVILHLGGIETTRSLHHIFGYIFAALAVYHVGNVLYSVLVKGGRPSMLLSLKDVRDAIQTLRYNLGLSQEHPQFDRFDFRQKFEYWGLVLGGSLMLVSGFILLFPTLVTRVLPGQFIPAAKAMHGYEGLMAFLIILVWHLYGAHLGPGKFPVDTTIFSGKIAGKRLLEEHPLEYHRLVAALDDRKRLKSTAPEETARQGKRGAEDDV